MVTTRRLEVAANTMAVIILQITNVSNQQVVCLKLSQCHMSIISLESWGGNADWPGKR